MTTLRIVPRDPTAADSLTTEKVTSRIGAIVHGINARKPLPEEHKAFLHEALLRHKVIFLRDQFLDDTQHETLSRIFGDPILHPTIPAAEGTLYTFELKSRNGRSTDSWHTDVTFVPAYPKASILRAITIPPYGGSTLWANTATAYDDLPASLQQLADTLWAVHGNDYDTNFYKYDTRNEEIADFRARFISRIYETEHPVVRVHPETGERTLILGHFFKEIRGIPTQHANRLLEIFQSYITQIDNTVRWNWKPGDIAIWDNRATQHYATADFDTHPRLLRRITVRGDIPVSVTGEPSRLLKGPDDGHNLDH
ncbi:TauD/TfdA dioxygenase family protein [Gluconobacter potus]|uniref:TauD/TfdA dioxygenase family protein n=1 Tax=Gluconobacter potus TaxID=2724927 RepID=UPI0039E9243A